MREQSRGQCRPAGSEVAEVGKKKSDEEVKAEQEAVSKEQTAALKKALSQITVSMHHVEAYHNAGRMLQDAYGSLYLPSTW